MKAFSLTVTLIVLMAFALADNASAAIKVTTGRMTKIKETQADCTYKVEGTVTEKGVCYSDTPSPTISHKKVTAPANSGSTVTSSLAGLRPGTKYYVRAYAKIGSEVVYGNELNFNTLPKGGESQPTTGPKNEPKPETPKK